ncbi:MAG: DUF3160 domain-containing protein, partial [Planctomycetes bacterium]|nr:DUF3160 domain-containing protein [Planctomycetota bacterium]
ANKRLASLDAIIQRLLDISVKELANKELAKDDYDFIKNFGANLSGATAGVDDKGCDTRIIADVHTNTYTKECVEEATGPLDWVVVVYKLPDGTLGMGVGPTLSYYEFKHPIADRLTDEKWQESLKDKAKAADRRPNWTGGFLAPAK